MTTRHRIVLRARGSTSLWTYSGISSDRKTIALTPWPRKGAATTRSKTFKNRSIALSMARRLAVELPGYAIAVVPATALPAAVLAAWPGAKVNPAPRGNRYAKAALDALREVRAIPKGRRSTLAEQVALGDARAMLATRRAIRAKKNPIAPDRALIEKAAKLRRDFTGHDATRVTRRKIKAPRVGLTVGPVLGIMYATTRDGKREKYLHRFKKNSRPLLAASHDGKTLVLVGGRYQFTDRGIVDT